MASYETGEVMPDNIFKEYQERIKKYLETGKTHSYGLEDANNTQAEVLACLRASEVMLIRNFNFKGYDKVSGFRIVIKDLKYQENDTSNILRPFMYIWEKPSEANQKKIESLKRAGLYMYDIRKKKDFEMLKEYFSFEFSNVIGVFEKLLKYNEPFPIVNPFYKCSCLGCASLINPMPDVMFREQALGRKNLIPQGNYLAETHSLFIMIYIDLFMTFWEPMSPLQNKASLKRFRLRDHLRKCAICKCYYLGKKSISIDSRTSKIKEQEFPCCENKNCIAKTLSNRNTKSRKTSIK